VGFFPKKVETPLVFHGFSAKKLQVRTQELIFPAAPEGLGPPTMLGCDDLRSATDRAFMENSHIWVIFNGLSYDQKNGCCDDLKYHENGCL